jgi:hypothetical protein
MKGMWLVVGMLAACTGAPSPTQPPTTTGEPTGGSGSAVTMMKPGKMKPTGGATFVKGAALTPAKDLIAWFDAQERNGEPRLTRVPVVLKREGVAFSRRGARIGTGPDALEVFVSDAALGIGITDRARKCTEPTCPFLVEGYWRGTQDGVYHYEIRTAGQKPLTAAELAAITHAEVEGESGN